MPYHDIGDKGYQTETGVATSTLTPLTDRTVKVTRIGINDASAADTWIVHTGASDVGVYEVDVDAPQNLLMDTSSVYPNAQNVFDFYSYMFGEDLIYPVPFGQHIEVKSVGGATADISFEYEEVAPNEVGPSMMNWPGGNRFVGPVYLSRAAPLTTVGESSLDTQVSRDDFVKFFFGDIIPSNWQVRILGMFLQAFQGNEFSGAADHVFTSQYFGAKLRNTRLWTREDLGGIPLIATGAAAGSTNIVFDDVVNPLPPFQNSGILNWRSLLSPLVLNPGDRFRTFYGVIGAFGDGGDASAATQVFLCDIRSGS